MDRLSSLFGVFFGNTKARRRVAKAKRHSSRRSFLEALEDRRMMAIVSIVANGNTSEGTGPGYFIISRDASSPDPLTVSYTITGSAMEIADYEAVGTSAVIPANQLSVTIPIESLVDNEFEPTEKVKFSLLPGTGVTPDEDEDEATVEIYHCNGYIAGPNDTPPGCTTCFGVNDPINGSSNGFLPSMSLGGTNGIIAGDQQLANGRPRLPGSVIVGNGIIAGDQQLANPLTRFGNRAASSSGGGGGGFSNVISRPGSQNSGGVIHGFSASGFSSHPVRYADGVVMVSSTDLASDGMGVPWGITRSWTNAQAHYKENVVGTRMIVSEQPYIHTTDNSRFFVFTNSYTVRGFDLVSGNYVARDFAQETLVHDDVNDEFVLTDTEGGVLKFFDLSAAHSAHKRGQFKSFTDAKGNAVSVVDHTTEGRIEEVQRSYTQGGSTYTESYLYTYVSTLVNKGLIESVVQRRRVDAGSWTTHRKAEYAYYGNDEDHGNRGDLKTATIKDGSNNVLDTTYYRYYQPEEANGFTHGLKYVLYPDSFARFSAEVGSPLTATDTALADYADHYFEYDSYLKATKEIAQGAGCSTCTGGQGSFTYSYTTGFDYDPDYNHWERKTVETLPDGNQNIVYTNYRGQVMLEVFKDTTTSQEWATYYRYDDDGRVLFRADPSAVSGYNDTYRALVKDDSESGFTYLRDSDGLITNFEYYTTTTATSSTPGGAAGYLKEVTVQEGELGTEVPQVLQEYISRAAGTTTIYLPATETVYANTDGTGGLTTSYAYTFYSGTVQVESQTTTAAGTGDQETVFHDSYGRPVWLKDSRGFLHYRQFDNTTGTLTKVIADVDHTETSDFIGLPSGWTTPTGGGQHVISTYEVDSFGRPTKVTDGNGNVSYIVYDDVEREIRVYPGWNDTTDAPTGPTIVIREDRDGSYTEVLTMSATPSLTADRPNGTEAIGNLQTLSRTHVNDAGQAIYVDEYFSFASLTYSTSASLGTEGTHFYRTEQAYDQRGRMSRVERADGTIYRTVFDGLGRPVSEWIGDDDTPVSGNWSPSNPADMIKVREYEYDSGNEGDSHLTSVTDALSRETLMEYDFHGRLLEATLSDPDGVGALASPVYASAYDNLNRLTSTTDPLGNVTTYAYDVPNRKVTVTLSDPDGPGPQTAPVIVRQLDAAGNLVSEKDPLLNETVLAYDGLNQLIKITLPDPDAGGSQTSPIWEYEYDAAGNLRFTIDPLDNETEQQYDKSNRLVKVIGEDPDGVGSITSPETDYAYDAAGFLLSVTDPMDRVTSYTYDRLGRMLTQTDPDPDAGGSLTSPVTEYAYDAASRLISVFDPLDNETEYAYDFFDRRTSITQPDPDAGGSLTAPVTSFTYDNVGNLLTLTDPVGNVTTWEYDNLNRTIEETNELLDVRTFKYDAASNLIERIDRLGRKIEYVYDNLHRMTRERWGTDSSALPSGSVSTTTEGSTLDEVQRVGFFDSYQIISGSFTLTYDGQTTGTISYDATAAQVETALEALSNIGDGDAVVTKITDTSLQQEWRIAFQGALAGTNVAQVTIDSSGVSGYGGLTEIEATDVNGGATNEVQVVTVSNATGGTFTLSLGGQTTSGIAYNASAASVETALEALSTVDDVAVTGNAGGPYTIAFQGTHAGENVAPLWTDGSGLTNANLVRTLEFSYDALGRMTEAIDPAATYGYTYDNLGRVTEESQSFAGFSPLIAYAREFDVASRVTSLAASIGGTADFENTYTYDNLHRLTRLQQADQVSGNAVAEKRADFAYNAAGQFEKISRYADVAGTESVANTFYSYDGIGRLLKLLHTTDGTAPGSGWGTNPLAGYVYAYDAGSRITSIDSYIDGLATYTHDNTDQLTGADHTSQTDESYTYDENGNRTMTGYSTGDNNQLTSDGTYNYTYDDEGNRLTKTKISTGEKEEYTWDHRNRLTKVTFKNSGGTVIKTVDHTYNVFNRWIRRSVDNDGPGGAAATDTFFSWLDDQIALAFDGATASDLSHRYFWNPAVIDQILADEAVSSLASPGDVLYPLTDHLGTPRDLAEYDSGTNTTAVVNHRVFDSYGKLVSETNSSFAIAIGFTGVYFDIATGLNYHRERWYDMATGRWMSEDPIGFAGDPSNIHRYVSNSPLSFVDPYGLDTEPLSEDIDEILDRYRRSNPEIWYELWVVLSVIQDVWLVPGGSDVCGRWQEAARDAIVDLGQEFYENEVYVIEYIDWSVNSGGWLEHNGLVIEFANGERVYLDSGTLGGSDHFFYPSEIPGSWGNRGNRPLCPAQGKPPYLPWYLLEALKPSGKSTWPGPPSH